MSRDDGFAIADVATGLYSDSKVVALARRLHDPLATAAHLSAYEALRLGSWGAGQRITLEEAMPAWWLDDVAAIAANLVAVGLITEDGRLPEHAWEAWFRPAWNRREVARAKGRKGGSRKPSSTTSPSPAAPQLEPSLSPAQPVRPSVPTEPSVPTDTHDAREPAEDVFDHLETKGIRVNRSNGHAGMVRDAVQRFGVDQVLAMADALEPSATLRDVAFAVNPAAAPAPRRRANGTDYDAGAIHDTPPTADEVGWMSPARPA